jgi:tetratricopeptide (TPR) repeat protein
MMKRFGSDAEVLMYLGSWFERIGQSKTADDCFDRALAADPQNAAAQRAAAIGLIQQQKPKEAEAKMAAFMPQSPLYEPSLLFMLAEAYQAAGDHEATVRLLESVAKNTPAAGKEKAFRQAVKKSEAALGRQGSMLTTIPIYRRPAFWWAALAAAVLVGFFALDRFFAQRREVFVVNGLSKPLKVQLDDREPVELLPNRYRTLTAPEGAHTIRVIEPAALAREQEFTIASSISGRWRGKQLNVVDPTCSAILLWERSVYALNRVDQTYESKIHVGEPYYSFDRIDYKFMPFPDSLRAEGRNAKLTKQRVGIEQAEPMQLLLG